MRKKEDVGIIVPASSEVYGQYPDPGFSDLIEHYRRDPMVRSAIDDLAERAVGMGFYTTSDIEHAKKNVDDFCDDVGLDQLNLEIAKHCFGFGNFFIEKIYDKYVETSIQGTRVQEPAKNASVMGLRPLPLSSFEKVYRDKYGNVIFYSQRVSGERVFLSPKIIIHFAYNVVDCAPFGLGLVQTLALPGKSFTRVEKDGSTTVIQRPSMLNIKQEFENSLRDWFRRYIGRFAFIWENEDSEKIQEYVAKLRVLKENQDIAVNVKEGAKLSITPLSIDPRVRFETMFDYVESQILNGLETPVNKLFTTPGFTEASAKAAVEVSERKVAAFQRYLKRKIEREIFRPIIEQNGMNWERSRVRLNWGIQEQPTLTVDHILKLAELSAQLGVEYIRPEELRKNLVKIGVELWEPEKTHESEEQ
ncbi:MAG: hypothetical protein QW761_02320 [Candidatus Aenigmatarchaeota archaeon]